MLCVHSHVTHQEVPGRLRVLQLSVGIARDNDHDHCNRWLEAHTAERQASERMAGLYQHCDKEQPPALHGMPQF